MEFATVQEITLVAELREFGLDSRPYRRGAARGDVVRLHRGAYMDAAAWRALSASEQYRHRVIAAARSSSSHPVLSHQSAAAVWGIPLIGPPPPAIHVLATQTAGTRSEGDFRRHATRFPEDDVVTMNGVRVTSLRRTLLELALTASFQSAVVAFDWAVASPQAGRPKPTVSAQDVDSCARDLKITRGLTRVIRVADFAEGLSGSPGESLSRAAMHELGFPAPVLQQRFDDHLGLIGFTDFWWPDYNLIGEFDGLTKYTREQFTRGTSMDRIVFAEKRREDRLRALGPAVTRWLWAEAMAPRMLFTQLRDAGLPTRRRA